MIGKTGGPLKAWEMIYKVVSQAVLLYGREIWVVTDAMMKVLEGICHKISIRVVGMTARRGAGSKR